jgi:hypothetical protein
MLVERDPCQVRRTLHDPASPHWTQPPLLCRPPFPTPRPPTTSPPLPPALPDARPRPPPPAASSAAPPDATSRPSSPSLSRPRVPVQRPRWRIGICGRRRGREDGEVRGVMEGGGRGVGRRLSGRRGRVRGGRGLEWGVSREAREATAGRRTMEEGDGSEAGGAD